MDELSRALVSSEKDTLTCSACEAQLAEYVEAQLNGRDDTANFAQLEHHLSVCPHCVRAYRELLELTRLAYSDAVPRPRRRPRFDLRFLEPERKSVWHWEGVRVIIDLTAALWQPPTHLTPAYAMKGGQPADTVNTGKEADEATRPRRFSLDPAELGDLRVEVIALVEDGDRDRCSLVAKIEVPSQWPNLSGIEVVLMVGETSLTQRTDDSGEVTFRGLPCSALQTGQLSIKRQS